MNVVSITPKRTRLSPPDPLIYFPVVERDLFWESRVSKDVFHASPDHKQLVRSDNGVPIPLAVVGRNYKVLQNEELFEAVEQNIIDTLPPEKLVNVTVTDQMSYDGAMCMREYVFGDITEDVPVSPNYPLSNTSKEAIAFRAIVINGFGNSAVKIIIGAIDFFCMNGMIIGIADKKVRRHTSGLDVTMLSSYITGNLSLFEKSAKQWCYWAKQGLSDFDAQELFKELVDGQYLSERLAHKLYTRFLREKADRGGTLWAFTSALTYYSSHDDDLEGFAVRKTDKDHKAATMMQREEQVRKIIRSEPFQRLAA